MPPAQETPEGDPELVVEVFSPMPGEAVQGLVQISGTVDVEDFQSYQIDFAFGDSSNQTWFPVVQSNNTIIDGILGEWDTSVLADRVYNLRLTVNRTNAEPTIVIIEGLRVRNYSPIETSTPQPTPEEQNATPTPQVETTPTHTIPPITTPTPLPENTASVGIARVKNAAKQGALAGIIFALFWLIYQAVANRNDR